MVIFFSDIFYLGVFIIIIFNLWNVFTNDNFYYLRSKLQRNDITSASHVVKKNHFFFFLKNMLILNMLFYLSTILVCFKGQSVQLWDHFSFSNHNLHYICYLFIFGLMCMSIIHRLGLLNFNLNVDLVFSISNLNVLIVVLYITSSLLSILFSLELITLFMLYKFTVSDSSSKFKTIKKVNTKSQVTKSKFETQSFKNNLNAIFFQYWSSFFSSILLIIAVVNTYNEFGSTNLNGINVFYNVVLENKLFTSKNEFIKICLPLITGILLKLGLTPLNLFKIEIYKGLPYVSIFLYTTYYFLTYFLFFSILFSHLVTISWYSLTYLGVLIIIGVIYLSTIMLDGLFIKTFLSFSTFINSLNFFLILWGSFI